MRKVPISEATKEESLARIAELEKRTASTRAGRLEFEGRLRRPERVWVGVHSQQTMESIQWKILTPLSFSIYCTGVEALPRAWSGLSRTRGWNRGPGKAARKHIDEHGPNAWQRSTRRDTMANNCRAQKNHYISGKPPVEVEDGSKASSLLEPPLGSLGARRRAKRIIKDMLRSNTDVLREYLRNRHQGCLPASLALAWMWAVQPPR